MKKNFLFYCSSSVLLMMISSSSCNQLRESYPQEYPFVAVLRSSNMRCIGAMVSHSAILTVSQCLTAPIMEVTLGAFDLTHHYKQFERGRIRFQVASDAFQYDPTGLVGMIRFTPLAMLNDFVNMVRVPFSSVNENYVNVQAIAIGFLREPQNYDCMHSIAISTLNSTNSSACSSNEVNPSGDLICSQAGAVCNLNLGAPLIVFNELGEIELIGLLTSPEYECNEQQPSGFIKINQFLRFIRGNM